MSVEDLRTRRSFARAGVEPESIPRGRNETLSETYPLRIVANVSASPW
jgi:hypothetical protein